MEPTLWEHQDKAVDGLRMALRNGYRRPALVMPTGSGKTYVFVFIAHRLSLKGKKVCIIVHRSYLLDQVSQALSKFGVGHGIIAPGHLKTGDNIQVASIDTLIKRFDQYLHFDLLIFDECHHVIGKNKWAKAIGYYNCYCMGVTATFSRTNGAGLGVKAGGYFDYLVQGPQILDITPEFLAPVRVFTPKNSIDSSVFSRKRVAGDFDPKEVESVVNRKVIYGNVPYTYANTCPDIPAIAFCHSINHAQNVAIRFKECGISATYITGKCSKKRRESVMAGYEQGIYKILCSCDLISEGFDVPFCGAVIKLRPTESLLVEMQQNGRCMRVKDGKECAFIIDHVNNIKQRHGMPDMNRVWSLEGTKKNVERSRSLITCPQCCRTQYATAKCIHCGFEFATLKKKRKGLTTDEAAVLEEMKTEYQKKEERKKKMYEMMEDAVTLKDYHKIAKELGYSAGWAWHVWNVRINQKKKVIL